MPEPVIVATARTPIGRAFKGSLVNERADDMAAFIVDAALNKLPELDRSTVDDLMLGCGLPGRRAGLQHGPRRRGARRHAPGPGHDRSPGTARARCRRCGWRPTRSRPARATCSSPPASRR